MILKKVVSGGQTGVDRAGLDAAIEAGITVGGYCPKGRLAEDGSVPDRYPLIEMTVSEYPSKTEKNVMESDGTLILDIGKLSGGTRLTLDCARKNGKPCLVVQLDREPETESVWHWAIENSIRIMNIAGRRESKHPGLHRTAVLFLRQLFQEG